MTHFDLDTLSWRQAASADLQAISRIADMVHVDLPERPEVFAEKLRLFPQGCFALVQDGSIVDYGISHPWILYSIPPLDTFLNELPLHSECLFIHDVVVLPQVRTQGLAGRLVQLLAGIAHQQGIPFLALVSVYDTHPLWTRYGFEIMSNPQLTDKLKTYGATAKYMTRDLLPAHSNASASGLDHRGRRAHARGVSAQCQVAGPRHLRLCYHNRTARCS
jgi:hypothetical protein